MGEYRDGYQQYDDLEQALRHQIELLNSQIAAMQETISIKDQIIQLKAEVVEKALGAMQSMTASLAARGRPC